MIRKAIIVMLTLGAVGILGTTLPGYSSRVVAVKYPLTPTLSMDIIVGMGNASYRVFEYKTPPSAPRWGFRVTRIPPEVMEVLFTQFLWRWDVGQPLVRPQRIVNAVCVPAWTLFLLLSAYPMIAFIRGPMRRYRRRKRGQCLGCGYSLEGNVTGVCPECGTEAERP